MTGEELKKQIFAPRELSEFANHIKESRQYVNSKLKAQKVDETFLRQYAAWKHIDADKFVLWARGPVPEKGRGYQFDTYTTELNDTGTTTYGSKGGSIDYESELVKIYKENVALHQTVADRGNFILRLLSVKGTPSEEMEKTGQKLGQKR